MTGEREVETDPGTRGMVPVLHDLRIPPICASSGPVLSPATETPREESMSPVRRSRRSETSTSRRIRAIAGSASLALVLTGCGLFGGGSDEDKVTPIGAAFLADW